MRLDFLNGVAHMQNAHRANNEYCCHVIRNAYTKYDVVLFLGDILFLIPPALHHVFAFHLFGSIPFAHLRAATRCYLAFDCPCSSPSLLCHALGFETRPSRPPPPPAAATRRRDETCSPSGNMQFKLNSGTVTTKGFEKPLHM